MVSTEVAMSRMLDRFLKTERPDMRIGDMVDTPQGEPPIETGKSHGVESWVGIHGMPVMATRVQYQDAAVANPPIYFEEGVLSKLTATPSAFGLVVDMQSGGVGRMAVIDWEKIRAVMPPAEEAAKEPAPQAVPDGFVLVSKKQLATLFDLICDAKHPVVPYRQGRVKLMQAEAISRTEEILGRALDSIVELSGKGGLFDLLDGIEPATDDCRSESEW